VVCAVAIVGSSVTSSGNKREVGSLRIIDPYLALRKRMSNRVYHSVRALARPDVAAKLYDRVRVNREHSARERQDALFPDPFPGFFSSCLPVLKIPNVRFLVSGIFMLQRERSSFRLLCISFFT
jgi:hypothetical protein